MPKIQSISVCIARVALDNVTSFATRTVSARDCCLILHWTPGLGFDFDEKAVRKRTLDSAKPWTVIK